MRTEREPDLTALPVDDDAETDAATLLHVADLVKTFPPSRSEKERVAAVNGVSFDVPAGQMYTLLGPSGCGKTTTLRSIAGLERPDRGEIVVSDRALFSSSRGVNVRANERGLGMVFQSYAI
jgi:iron(III) transport system ATP-binding protein